MKDTVIDFIQAEGLLKQGDSVVVGVSGGADSVCLFLLLTELQKALSLSLLAVHIEHGIRGEESRADAEFVHDFCRKLGVECRVTAVDVPEMARRLRCGEEEAGRIARRRVFAECGKEAFGRGFKIALGHHMDDTAETMLFSLARGTGLAGLCGIRPLSYLGVMDGRIPIIHPLLCLRRKQIEEYLRQRSVVWRTDRTNATDDYARNRLRHTVIPGLCTCNDRAVEHLAQTAAHVRRVEEYIRQQAAQAFENVICGDGALDREKLSKLHPALAGEVIRLWLLTGGAGLRDVSRIHVDAVLQLASGRPGRKTDLPGGWSVRSGHHAMVLERTPLSGDGRQAAGESLEKAGESLRETGESLRKPGESLWEGSKPVETARRRDEGDRRKSPDAIRLSPGQLQTGIEVTFGGYRFRFCVLNRTEFEEKGGYRGLDHENSFSICVNCDKIDDVCLRFPVPGDRMMISRDGRHKSLKRIWIDERIDRERRRKTPVVVAGEEIIWLVGIRDCPVFFVGDTTGRVLHIRAWRCDYGREDQGDAAGRRDYPTDSGTGTADQ